MAQTVISAKYPPQIDTTRTPLAYGDGALPRLVSNVNVNVNCATVSVTIPLTRRGQASVTPQPDRHITLIEISIFN